MSKSRPRFDVVVPIASVSPLGLDEAERVTRRVQEHPPFARTGLRLGLDRTERENRSLAFLEVWDVEVQVSLLWRTVRPHWRSIVGISLKAEVHARAGVETNPVIGGGRRIDLSADHLLVEGCQDSRIRTVERDESE